MAAKIIKDKVIVSCSAITKDRDKYLVVKESSHGLEYLNQPAGELKKGEKPEDGIRREVLEETGYKIQVNLLLKIYYTTSRLSGKKHKNYCFICSLKDKRQFIQSISDPKIKRVIWMTKREILENIEKFAFTNAYRAFLDYFSRKNIIVS